MTARVAVVDTGLGNLHSVVKALRWCSARVDVITSPGGVEAAERLVLPGVGAFPDGMRNLAQNDLPEALRRYAMSGRPILGICLGMQMLFSESEEFGRCAGLGIVPGRVVAIPRESVPRLPHMGWSRLRPRAGASFRGTPLERLSDGQMVYFAHGFRAVPDCDEDRLAEASYGRCTLVAAVRRGNVFGCQFHPEKSGDAGLAILAAFLQASGGGP